MARVDDGHRRDVEPRENRLAHLSKDASQVANFVHVRVHVGVVACDIGAVTIHARAVIG